jgi:hypothetical protein
MKFNVKINGHPGYLPAGTYQVKITHASKRTAKCSGNSQLELELEALGGEHEGKIARAWLTKARGTERLWQYFAKAVFPEATGASIAFGPGDLVDREVRIKVEWPEEAEYPQVVEYYAAG